MNLPAIASYLSDDLDVGLTKGKNLFVHAMPAGVEGAMLRDPFGGTMIDYELTGFRKTGFQLIVRGSDYEKTQQLAVDISAALTVQYPLDLPGMAINYLRPRHEPVGYPCSAGSNWEFSVNFDACYVVAL